MWTIKNMFSFEFSRFTHLTLTLAQIFDFCKNLKTGVAFIASFKRPLVGELGSLKGL
jgi:hypothetical protein